MSKRLTIKTVLLVSFVAKLIYVFVLTDYSKYLFSDCGGYWSRALERLAGKEIIYSQWAIWPPFPHILLSKVFALLQPSALFAYKHQIVILLNVVMSTCGVWFLYQIALSIKPVKNVALWISGAYAFSFPFFYFNAFVLSEHPALFFLLVSLYLALKFPQSMTLVLLSGLSMGLSVGLRPANALLGGPVFIYLFFKNREIILQKIKNPFSFPPAFFPFSRFFNPLLRSALFSLGFFLVVGGVVMENYRISEGKLASLSAHGGVNFYFAQCHTHKFVSHYKGYTYTLVPPSVVDKPQNGTLEVNEPAFNQKYFFDLGWECMKNNWLENIGRVKLLYFSPLFPNVGSAYASRVWMPVFRYVLLGMTASMLFFFFVLKDIRVDKKKFLLIFSIPFFQWVMMYFFNYEHRYLYSFAFVFYVTFFMVLFSFKRNCPLSLKGRGKIDV